MLILVTAKRFLLLIITLILTFASGCGGRTIPVTTPTIEDIIATVSPAVVRIITQKTMGSGMIIDKEGYILTNSHVVKDIASVKVELSSGEQMMGSVVGRDEINDLAIIKIDRAFPTTVTLGNSSELRSGQEVIAIGYPLDLSGSVTVTKGIVSAIRDYDLIQTDVAINPGNSGGPLINLKGEVIGVNFAGINIFRGITVQGMNFAVAINTAKAVIPDLKAGRSTFSPERTPTTTPKPTPAPTPAPTLPNEPQYTLSINGRQVKSSSISVTGGTISVSLAPDANGKYTKGSTLTLTATPNAGWQVGRWSGTVDDFSISKTNTVTMSSDKSVSVFFKRITHTLIINPPSPANAGTISPSPGNYNKNDGEVVSLTAIPNAGWQVERWSGTDDDSSTSKTNTVTVNSDKSITVFFKESIPTTVFTYSGTGRMNTPPFEVNSSPWKLHYKSNVTGTITIRAHPVGVGMYEVVASHTVEAGKVYETYVYNITGSRYFSVENDGDWTLSVVEHPSISTTSPGTIFTYSGTGRVNTPPFAINSSPWKLRFTSSVTGTITVRAHPVGGGMYEVAASQSVEAGKVYETYVYNITGSRYFSVENDGNWTLWVIEEP